MEIVIEKIPLAPMKRILELAKKQTGEVVIIPQCPGILSQERNWNIAGIVGGSIVATSLYNDAVLGKHVGMLWKDISVPYISLLYKDINPFLKMVESTNETELSFLIHSYDINGIRRGIAFGLSVGPLVYDNGMIVPNLALIPYEQQLMQISTTRLKWSNSIPVGTLWLNEEKTFKKIWNGKASDGARAWIPKSHIPGKDLSPYIMYLSKTMFVFSKNDQVIVELRDEIMGEHWNKFMAEFNVKRKSKGCTSNHFYTLMGFKL